ncbi:MAG: M20/M25/M40 family metallo-hydrolase [Pirellulaceae bacterium]
MGLGLALLSGMGSEGHGGSAWAAEDASAVEARLLEAVKYLADDEREGRGTGTKGIEQAADYIAAEFSKLGLKTSWFEGGPFQTLEVVTQAKLGPAGDNRLLLTGPADADGKPRRLELKLGEDFNTLAIGGTHEASAPVVFVGYGITAKDPGYDDYAGLDVKGKVVVILRKEPQQADEKSPFGGKTTTQYATFDTKVSNAYQHGAAAVILVNDAHGLGETTQQRREQWTEALTKLAEEQAKFKALAQPTDVDWKAHQDAVAKLADRLTALHNESAGGADQVLAPDAAGYTMGARKMSVFFARRAPIDDMVRAALGKDLTALERDIDGDLKPRSRELAGWQAEVESSIELVKVRTRNVVAVLEGSGRLADETVILGAHYDHLGMGGRDVGSLAPWTSAIHNGADDNASGTVALLEIARRLTAGRPAGDSRRVVFIAFTAEERGLLGSRHYADNPLFPLDKTVAMVNLDMVGRLNENKLIVYGTGTSAKFDGLIDQLNKPYAFELKKDPAGEGPSDHQTFYRKNIPVLHFFTGSHSDYHRPSDDVERINVPGMRRISELVSDVVAHLATVSERPDYLVVKSRASIHSGEGARPSLGTMPDYAATVEGCRLEYIRKDGPADRAGIKVGDIITRLGANQIGSVEDYDSALRKFRPGDTIKIEVKRDGKSLEVEATLGQPR